MLTGTLRWQKHHLSKWLIPAAALRPPPLGNCRHISSAPVLLFSGALTLSRTGPGSLAGGAWRSPRLPRLGEFYLWGGSFLVMSRSRRGGLVLRGLRPPRLRLGVPIAQSGFLLNVSLI